MDIKEVKAIDKRIKLLLAIIGMATLFMLIAAGLRENVFNQWRFLRAEYGRILQEKATDERTQSIADQYQVIMEQNVLPALGRIDRCITCHPGIDDPRMSDLKQPFKTHPGNYTKDHPQEKFGCTICHRGQGRAVIFDEAKGVGHHWDYPLLPSNLTQSSCGVCHTPGEVRENGGEKYAYGKELFDAKGCLSCHRLNDRGGNMGPELDTIGLKVMAELPMAEVHGEHTLPQWLMEHFDDPQKIVADSQMKSPKLSPDENEALTIYMLSLQGRDLPESFISAQKHFSFYKESFPDQMTGEQLYNQFCSNCHDTGQFGKFDKFFNKFMPAIRGSSYVQLATNEYLKQNIQLGRPGTIMPGWEKQAGGLTDEEIQRIQDYLLSTDVPENMKLDANLIKATNDPSLTFRGDESRGMALFNKHCFGCHGSEGVGDLAPSLTSTAFQKYATDGFIYATIAAGRKNTVMPAFLSPGGGGLGGRDMMDLVSYIRSLVTN